MSHIRFPSAPPFIRGDKTYTSRVVVGHTETGQLVLGIEDHGGWQTIYMPLDQARVFLDHLSGVIEALRNAADPDGG